MLQITKRNETAGTASANGSCHMSSVSVSVGVTSSPGAFLTVSAGAGAGARASLAISGGIISPNAHGTSSGVASAGSVYASSSLGPGVVDTSFNDSGVMGGFLISTPTQVHAGGSYSLYIGAPGASGAPPVRPPAAQKKKPHDPSL